MTGHGGNLRELAEQSGVPQEDILDFSANLNPLGPPEWLRRVVSRGLDAIGNYPDSDCLEFRRAVAERIDCSAENVVAGNGANQLIYLLPQTLSPQRVVICSPCYADYERAAKQAAVAVVDIPLKLDDFEPDWAQLKTQLRTGDMLFLTTPNNPTGNLFDETKLGELATAKPDVTFVVDESFLEFDRPALLSPHFDRGNVISLRSLTKFYAIAGLRLGYLIATDDIAARIYKQLPDWSVNSLALSVGIRAVQDDDYAARTRSAVGKLRRDLEAQLRAVGGIEVYPGRANYLFCRLEKGTAQKLAEQLMLKHQIAIRVCANYATLDDQCFRIAVRSADENLRLINAMNRELRGRKAPRQRRTPSIMFQGTSSNAGKSLLTAAFCRILLQDGIRVAPFKAQNMSNNSFVCPSGDEIARAQVVQAQACRIQPDHRISPILLKPNSDTGSQVILAGQPIGNMRVREYERFKPTAFAKVKECYDSLAAEYDAIVLEGAGSPGEVNLKANDIVNMNMARYAQSPVLLVGDIDRGGVFAGYVGTMEVLNQAERDLVAGFIVNKFRGDASLLDDAYRYMLDHTGKPVLGCVPYQHAHGIPEEDSVSFKEGLIGQLEKTKDRIKIAVVDLPHISNFTDLDAFTWEPDVELQVVRPGEALGNVDAVILPGSKNTIADMRVLRDSGMAEQLRRIAEREKVMIIGICGGFQMLGTTIKDPACVESENEEIRGLGLLDMETIMEPQKTLQQVETTHLPSGLQVAGYEIHHGKTHASALDVIVENKEDAIGYSSTNRLIWGSYLHGIFDSDSFRRWIVDELRTRRGLQRIDKILAPYDLEPAFDKLAEAVRESLDLQKIYQAMGL